MVGIVGKFTETSMSHALSESRVINYASERIARFFFFFPVNIISTILQHFTISHMFKLIRKLFVNIID